MTETRVGDPLVNSDPPVRYSEWAASLDPGTPEGIECVNIADLMMKQLGDPGIKPGDVVVFEPAGRHWGHVEVVPPRDHWLKRLFLRGR